MINKLSQWYQQAPKKTAGAAIVVGAAALAGVAGIAHMTQQSRYNVEIPQAPYVMSTDAQFILENAELLGTSNFRSSPQGFTSGIATIYVPLEDNKIIRASLVGKGFNPYISLTKSVQIEKDGDTTITLIDFLNNNVDSQPSYDAVSLRNNGVLVDSNVIEPEEIELFSGDITRVFQTNINEQNLQRRIKHRENAQKAFESLGLSYANQTSNDAQKVADRESKSRFTQLRNNITPAN